jgi:hypothetical protein
MAATSFKGTTGLLAIMTEAVDKMRISVIILAIIIDASTRHIIGQVAQQKLHE